MSAETLREAARLMRERAEAATKGRWVAKHHPGHFNGAQTLYSASGGGYIVRPAKHGGMFNHPHDADHIASWHPAVALAVADWLDHDARASCTCGDDYGPTCMRRAALAVATAYLGQPAPTDAAP